MRAMRWLFSNTRRRAIARHDGLEQLPDARGERTLRAVEERRTMVERDALRLNIVRGHLLLEEHGGERERELGVYRVEVLLHVAARGAGRVG